MNRMDDTPIPADPSLESRGPRIFVDCTQTVRTKASTGIPRVVANIVKHGRRAARHHGAELIPVRFNGRGFVAAAMSANGDLLRFGQPTVVNAMHPTVKRLRTILVPKFLKRFFYKQADRILSGRLSPVCISAGDVLLLPDSSWTERMWGAVDKALAQGAILGVIQHDFIPIRNPTLVPAESTKVFRRWAEETLQRAHFVVAVSQAVAVETREELTKLHRLDVAEHRVTTFRNGADLPAPSTGEYIRPELSDFIGRAASNGPYLTVGTVEPRKNQAVLLAAIGQVLSRAPDARFLLAGMIGWQGRPVAESIARHPGWPRNIRHFADLTDAELRFAYKHAKAVIFPSLAEGYGLPIVESLANGTRVFASDIAVHREIGEPHCVFFDPLNPLALADLIIAHSLHGTYAASWPPADYKLPRWSDAANDIVETSLAHARQATHSVLA